MYFASMRAVQDYGQAWYEAKKAKDNDHGMGALIAVMRKLALATYAVGARDEMFDPARLFPGKRVGKQRRAPNRQRRVEPLNDKRERQKELFGWGPAPKPRIYRLGANPEGASCPLGRHRKRCRKAGRRQGRMKAAGGPRATTPAHYGDAGGGGIVESGQFFLRPPYPRRCPSPAAFIRPGLTQREDGAPAEGKKNKNGRPGLPRSSPSQSKRST
jgi:hypothetical protein